MSDMLPPVEMTLAAAGNAMRDRLSLAERAPRECRRAFYDTFDGLLHAAGLSAVHADGVLALVEQDTGRARARLRIARPTLPLLAFELEPGPMREALLPIVEFRALLALVEVASRILPLDVLDDERKTIVRMTLEESQLSSNGRRRSLRLRAHLAPVRGYEKALERVRRTLGAELGFTDAAAPLVDEAVLAVGGRPDGTSAKIDVPLRAEQRADAAAVAVLLRLLDVIEANVDGALTDLDSEFLHDLRVAVRRTRSVQRELRGVFGPAELARFRTEFRWLQQATGDVRDLDVYVLEFAEFRAMIPLALRPDLEPLLGVLRTRRAGARRAMVRELRSVRAGTLLSEWRTFLGGLTRLPEHDRPDAARPIGELAGERIRKVYKRMLKMGGAIDAASPPQDYHELRKKGKELRYMLELFGAPLYPAAVVKPMIKALKSLQDVLGRHQDREVQVATLRALLDEVSALPGGAAALMAIGVLVQELGADERAARAEFAQRFAAFASMEQRRQVKDTFA
jgi:CHAD domain-containing protein